MSDLVGKTIAAVEELGDWSYDKMLVFTDGTRAILSGTGYEADGVYIEPLTAAQWLIREEERAYEEDIRRDRDKVWGDGLVPSQLADAEYSVRVEGGTMEPIGEVVRIPIKPEES